jgi:hypothetical protein
VTCEEASLKTLPATAPLCPASAAGYCSRSGSRSIAGLTLRGRAVSRRDRPGPRISCRRQLPGLRLSCLGMDSISTIFPVPALASSPSFTAAGSESNLTWSSPSRIAPDGSISMSLRWPLTRHLCFIVRLPILLVERKPPDGCSPSLRCPGLFDGGGELRHVISFILRPRTRDH